MNPTEDCAGKAWTSVSVRRADKERILALAKERGQSPGVYLSALLTGRDPAPLPPDPFREVLGRLREVSLSLSRLADAAERGEVPPDRRYGEDLLTVQKCIGDLIRAGYGA